MPYQQCHSCIVEVDFNKKVWFINLVSLYQGCCIIKSCTKEVGLYVQYKEDMNYIKEFYYDWVEIQCGNI